MTLQDELTKLYVGIAKRPDSLWKGDNYLWVVGKVNYDNRVSGRVRSPYSIKMLDRMVYRHYID